MLTIKILSIHLKKNIPTKHYLQFLSLKERKKTNNIKKHLILIFFFWKKKKKKSQECEWGSGSDPCHGIGVLLPFFDGNQLC